MTRNGPWKLPEPYQKPLLTLFHECAELDSAKYLLFFKQNTTWHSYSLSMRVPRPD